MAAEAISAGRIRELDAWRTISVLMVVLYHLLFICYPGWLQNHSLLNSLLGHSAFYAGDLGVRIFFVISGFVICRLLRSEQASMGRISLRGFYIRRAARILPPLLVYLACLAVLLIFGLINERFVFLLGAMLFVKDFWITPEGWFTNHTWSLAVEEQFYLLFPALWLLIPSKLTPRVFLGVFLLCAAWNQLLMIPWLGSAGLSITRSGFAAIAWGVTMAINEAQIRSVARRLPVFLFIGICALLVAHPVHKGTSYSLLFDGLLEPPLIGLMLIWSLERGPKLRRILLSSPVQTCGLMSYGIYLWQQLFTGPHEDYLGKGKTIPFLIPALVVIVPISYYFVEKPLQRIGRRLSQRVANGTRSSDRQTGAETPAIHLDRD